MYTLSFTLTGDAAPLARHHFVAGQEADAILMVADLLQVARADELTLEIDGAETVRGLEAILMALSTRRTDLALLTYGLYDEDAPDDEEVPRG